MPEVTWPVISSPESPHDSSAHREAFARADHFRKGAFHCVRRKEFRTVGKFQQLQLALLQGQFAACNSVLSFSGA